MSFSDFDEEMMVMDMEKREILSRLSEVEDEINELLSRDQEPSRADLNWIRISISKIIQTFGGLV